MAKDAIQAFVAGIEQRPTEAYSSPAQFLPRGSKYDEVFNEKLNDDYRLLLYPYCVKEYAKKNLNYGKKGGHKTKRYATLFFVALFTLAFTSIVAQMESILGGLMNIELKIKRGTYLLILSILALFIGIPYMRTNGIYVMDIVGYFLNYGILGTALMQTIVVGWIYNAEKLRTTLNHASNANISPFFDLSLKYFIPVILLTLICHQAINDLTARYENFSLEYLLTYGIGTLVFILIFGVIISHFDHSRNKLRKSIAFRD